MRNISPKYIFLAVGLLMIGLGAVFYVTRESGDKKSDEVFFIDYEKFERLAAEHPVGETYINRIRESEKLLNDEDKGNDASAYFAIAFDMRQLGDDAGAISTYKEGLKIDPTNLLGLNNIATSYRDTGDFKGAEEAYRRLIEASPGDIAAYRNLADVYRTLYPTDEGGLIEIISQGLETVPDQTGLLTYLAVYYRDRGNIDKAIEYFEGAIKTASDKEIIQAELDRLRNK